MIVRVHCPHPDCHKRYRVDESQLGHATVCKQCGREFVLSASERDTPAPGVQSETLQPTSPSPVGETPKKLGRFEIRARLGAGSFGSVYRAYDPVLEREVALKVPRAAALEKPEARARFLREPKAAAQLRHPHIVPVFDASTDGEWYYIASAFIEGQTLETLIDQDRPDFRRSAQIVRDLADALDYAHRSGVIHRDVKPGNIMIDANGESLLMDFGLARFEESEEKLTQDGSVMGTPAYMAPEQASREFGEVGPAADQYSLGVVLYELLCGRTPFSGPPAVLIFNTLHREADPPRRVNPAIPRDLETICRKAMAKSPPDRYADCSVLAEDLRRWLDDEPIHARRMGPGERLWRWCRRNPTLAGLSAVSLLLLLWVAVVASIANVQISAALSQEALQRGEAETQRNQAETARRRAETERTRAEDALKREAAERRTAETQRRQADAERRRAESQQEQADAERRRAESEKQKAEEETARAERNLYYASISHAHDKWLAADVGECERMLDSCPGDLRQWEWAYLKRLCHLEDRSLHVRHSDCMATSENGRRIATGGMDGKIRIIDPETSKESLGFSAHNCVDCVSFSPDGQWLVSGSRGKAGSDPGEVKVWDANTGEEVTSLDLDTDCVESVCFSPDGRRMASAGGNKVHVYDVKTGQRLRSFTSSAVGRVAFSPDGRRIVSGSYEGMLNVWDAQTGRQVFVAREHDHAIGCVAFSPDGRRVASGSSDKTIRVCDAQTGELQLTLHGHSSSVNAVAFSPDGRRVASGSKDKTARLWDAETGKEINTIRAGENVDNVCFGPSGHQIMIGSSTRVTFWDVRKSQVPLTLRDHGSPLLSVAFDRDSRRIFSESDNCVKVWDAITGQGENLISGHGRNMALSPDKRQIAGRTHRGLLKVWSADSGEEILTLGRCDVFDLCLSSDGRLFAACKDGGVKVWEIDQGREVLSFGNHSQGGWQLSHLTLSPDGRQIAGECIDSTVRIWETATGKLVRSMARSSGPVAFSPDGRWIFAGPGIWEWATGEKVSVLGGWRGGFCVTFSPDGQRLVSGHFDGTLKIWDPSTGRETLTLRGHSLAVSCVAFSPDGHRIVSGSQDETVKVWDASPPAQIVSTKSAGSTPSEKRQSAASVP